jgi:hypothetical protein
MTVFNFLIFCALAITAYYYFLNLRLREIATIEVAKHCHSIQVQLLDQSVSLKRSRPALSSTSGLTLKNCYDFEFSTTGDKRYQGNIIMFGKRVESIWLQAHRLPDNEAFNP